MRTKSTLLLTSLLLIWNFAPISANEETAKQNAKNLVQRILSDPLIPANLRDSKLMDEGKDRYGNFRYTVGNKSVPISDLPASLIIRIHKNYSFDFTLRLWQAAKNDEKPNWDELQLEWDSFIEKYWPEMQRVSDWRIEILRYRPGTETLSMRYATKKYDVTLRSVELDIRLEDGKIGGVNFGDASNFINNKLLPAPVPEADIIRAISKSLSQRKEPLKIQTIRILSKDRMLASDFGKPLSFLYSVNAKAETLDGKTLSIISQYDESKSKAEIIHIDSFIERLRKKNYTIAQDKSSYWHSDNSLYFSTTREVEKHPWWQRTTPVHSTAFLNLEEKIVRLVRPIKPLGADFSDYRYPQLSKMYLSATQGSNSRQLFILDKDKGILYLPDRDLYYKQGLLRMVPNESYLPKLEWEVVGSEWTTEINSLLIALKKDVDTNIYLARWKDLNPDHGISLIPVILDRGDDVILKLSEDGKLLSWIHQVYKRERDKKPDEKNQWQFIIANFDVTTAKAINRRVFDLPNEPTSISFDDKNNRWLITLQTGEMLWIKEEDGKLVSGKAGTIKWGEIGLKPTSADVSPDGSKIAVAAELAKPQVYEKTECVVHSLIFLWDGKSEQVKPAYEPSLNGIPRYTFPNGSPWAKIVGDVKKFGLDGIADPAYFVPSPRPAPVKPQQ